MTDRISLNRGWEFTESFDQAFAEGGGAPGIVSADLPHTCRITPYHYFDENIYQMVCGYRRKLTVPAAWADRRVFLTIEAAGHSAEVFADGKKLAEHHCGYTAFTTELTNALTPGAEVLLAVKVDSRESQDIPPFGHVIDYMTYGGLYREVWLEVRDRDYIDDVFVSASVDPQKKSALVTSRISLVRQDGEACVVRQRVCPAGESGPAVILTESPVAGSETQFSILAQAEDITLWDVDAPALYDVTTELVRDGVTVDTVVTRTGFRRAEFRADGFFLNGRRLKLVGLNRHQSYPFIGYAAPRSLQRLDADILRRELGLNAVRTSHYPQSRHFIDRCDEVGLLVFTEIPGWQHIGGEAWKDQAVRNTRDMVRQYRNHPSIILWGVRINESPDDDAFYRRTNAAARELDPTRPTSGVRYIKKSSLLEDVYAYNDFSHVGTNAGCEKKKAVTSDRSKPYLISEYNGHMFPTKPFDCEEHRLSHALRHAAVLDAAAAEGDIAGSFGWCMTDYNTHRDFGSGDRICYHGVMDMFRNKKLAADVYAARSDDVPVLSVSSSMDIGEHPGGNRGRVFAFTNADEVRVYKNDTLIRSYTHADTPYRNLPRGPMEISDFVGDLLKEEGFAPAQERLVRQVLSYAAKNGTGHLSPGVILRTGWLMLRYGMRFADAYALYGKYIGDWGGTATEYRFEAVKNGQVVKTVVRRPVESLRLSARVDHTDLVEGATYDAALVRLAMTDQDGNVLPFYSGPVEVDVEGPVALMGPVAPAAWLRGGTGGVFVRSLGQSGQARITLRAERAEPVSIGLSVTVPPAAEI